MTQIEEAREAGKNGKPFYHNNQPALVGAYGKGLREFLTEDLARLGLPRMSEVDISILVQPRAIAGFIHALMAAGILSYNSEGSYTHPIHVASDRKRQQQNAAEIHISQGMRTSTTYTQGLVEGETYVSENKNQIDLETVMISSTSARYFLISDN